MNRSLLSCLLAAWSPVLWGTSRASALADPSAEQSVLVWVVKDKKPSADIARELQTALVSQGTKLGDPSAAVRAAACTEPKCFANLLTNHSPHKMALTASIQSTAGEGPERPGQYVELVVQFYAEHRNWVAPAKGRCPKQEQFECLKTLSQNLLSNNVLPAFSDRFVAPGEKQWEDLHRTSTKPIALWRGVVAGALGSVVVVGLGAGIALSLYHGQPAMQDAACDDARSVSTQKLAPTERNLSCRWDATLPLSLSYAASGLAAAGMGISLGLR